MFAKSSATESGGAVFGQSLFQKDTAATCSAPATTSSALFGAAAPPVPAIPAAADASISRVFGTGVMSQSQPPGGATGSAPFTGAAFCRSAGGPSSAAGCATFSAVAMATSALTTPASSVFSSSGSGQTGAGAAGGAGSVFGAQAVPSCQIGSESSVQWGGSGGVAGLFSGSSNSFQSSSSALLFSSKTAAHSVESVRDPHVANSQAPAASTSLFGASSQLPSGRSLFGDVSKSSFPVGSFSVASCGASWAVTTSAPTAVSSAIISSSATSVPGSIFSALTGQSGNTSSSASRVFGGAHNSSFLAPSSLSSGPVATSKYGETPALTRAATVTDSSAARTNTASAAASTASANSAATSIAWPSGFASANDKTNSIDKVFGNSANSKLVFGNSRGGGGAASGVAGSVNTVFGSAAGVSRVFGGDTAGVGAGANVFTAQSAVAIGDSAGAESGTKHRPAPSVFGSCDVSLAGGRPGAPVFATAADSVQRQRQPGLFADSAAVRARPAALQKRAGATAVKLTSGSLFGSVDTSATSATNRALFSDANSTDSSAARASVFADNSQSLEDTVGNADGVTWASSQADSDPGQTGAGVGRTSAAAAASADASGGSVFQAGSTDDVENSAANDTVVSDFSQQSPQKEAGARVSARVFRSSLATARRRRSSDSSGATVDRTHTARSHTLSSSTRSLTSLLCKDVPESCGDRRILLRHFGRYGRVERLAFNRAKLTAVVHFADHASAELAKRNGAHIHAKLAPMTLFWRQGSCRRDSDGSGTAAPSASPAVASEVLDELQAMQGADSFTASHDSQPKRARRLAGATLSSHRTGAASATARVRASGRAGHAGASAVFGGVAGDADNNGVPAAASTATASSAVTSAGIGGLELHLQPAVTATERYRTLDARDKQLRDKLRRKSGGQWSSDLVGTCQDMCPEKERYMREAKHDINALFERSTDAQALFDMDHRRAVKKYSRSSADQEAALAHELRTTAALGRTVDYLVLHVINGVDASSHPSSPSVAQCSDTQLGDWFEFVWDRLRAVRKDIGQQQLCSPQDVALVEKCARFHVHCAAALSHLAADKFDQKINSENLTKCLQTLKYMYHDLSVKGIRCDNEPEFRAYDILLNLNQGDTLREIQTLCEWVRDAAPVSHALRLHSALCTNNYVRFHRLCAGADYLQSCLLQRYLCQARTAALHAIVQAHCPSKHTVEYPLDELVRILAFEDRSECCEFLLLHGIVADRSSVAAEAVAESEERLVARLVRANFSEPESVPPLPSAPSLISSKLRCSVGEVVNGGCLPADPLADYRPHTSFDSDGRLIDWQPPTQCVAAAGGADAAAAATAGGAEAGGLLDQLVDELVRGECVAAGVWCRVACQLASTVYLESQTRVLPPLIRRVCEEELEAAHQTRHERLRQRQQLQLQKQRESAVISAIAMRTTQELIADVCSHQLQIIAAQLLRQLTAAANKAAFFRATESASAALLTETVSQQCGAIAAGVWREQQQQQCHLLQSAACLERRLLLKRCWAVWRASVSDRRHCCHLAAPIARRHSLQTALSLLGGRLPHARSLTSSVTFVERCTEAALSRMQLHNKLLSEPISLERVLTELVQSTSAPPPSAPLLWKLAVYCTAAAIACECGVVDWLLKKLTDQSSMRSEHPVQLLLQRGEISLRGGASAHFMASVVQDLDVTSLAWRGTSAVLVPTGCTRCVNELLNSCQSPLHALPDSVPVLTLGTEAATALGSEWAWPVIDSSHFHQLTPPTKDLAPPQRLTVVLNLKDANNTNNSVQRCVCWLFERRCQLPAELAAGQLGQLLEQEVCHQVVCRVQSQRVRCRALKRVEPPPEALVSLFNGTVAHVAAVLSSETLRAIWWPPPELAALVDTSGSGRRQPNIPAVHWNWPPHLAKIRQMVLLASLPDWPPSGDVTAVRLWSECCQLVLDYGAMVSDGDSHWHAAELRHSLEAILSRWMCSHPCRDQLFSSQTDCLQHDEQQQQQQLQLSPATLPWTDIIMCCGEHCVRRVTWWSDTAVADVTAATPVFHLPAQMTAFTVPAAWLSVTTTPFIKSSLSADAHLTAAVVKRRLSGSEELGAAASATKRSPPKLSDWELTLNRLISEGDPESNRPSHLENGCHRESADDVASTAVNRQLNSLTSHLSADRRVSSLWTEHLEELVSQGENHL